jgi:HAD superfamily hydrolase (TIGR01484 family)
MRYLVLACDYDGTLATHGRVNDGTLAALERLRASGRMLLLVTGRELHDLQQVFSHLHLFNLVVAENGALLYDPQTKSEHLLTDPPAETFVNALREHNVSPLSVGKAIVATSTPHETTVLRLIRELGLELQVSFNKGAVMVLPSGVNKASGLLAALKRLGLSAHNVVGVGDAENDHAFLNVCECSVAVDNALDSLKHRADMVTVAGHGAGVAELIRKILEDDLRQCQPPRHMLLLGRDKADEEIKINAYGPVLLIAGPSGSGKSTTLAGLLERATEAGYQFCLVDPEGDFEHIQNTVVVGSPDTPPHRTSVLELIDCFQNSIVNLLGVPMNDRPACLSSLLPAIQEKRALTGRPHWLVFDEAHHLLPVAWCPAPIAVPQQLFSTIFVTVHPDHMSEAALKLVGIVLAVGRSPRRTLEAFARAANVALPPGHENTALENNQALTWLRERNQILLLDVQPGKAERQRHRRKYAEGDIQEKSFYFRGPDNKLNLRAQNLALFLQIADGVDDETWMFHLRQGDYSEWVRVAIKDERLAQEVARIEAAKWDASESKSLIKAAIERLYTSAA